MKIDGGCHCGNITYEAEVDPEEVIVCHCTDCQALSGSAFRTVAPLGSEDFRFLGAQPKVYVKVADSGASREQAFCPECGSHIYATSVGDGPKVLGVRVGTIRQRASLEPRKQVWCRSRLDWVDRIADLERVD